MEKNFQLYQKGSNHQCRYTSWALQWWTNVHSVKYSTSTISNNYFQSLTCTWIACKRSVLLNLPMSWKNGQNPKKLISELPTTQFLFQNWPVQQKNGLFPLCCSYKDNCIDNGNKKREVAEKNTAEIKDEDDVFEKIFWGGVGHLEQLLKGNWYSFNLQRTKIIIAIHQTLY